ncbi:hypothetical protein [Candidatus Terasakiella magnetica]|uniref:hypothetical protein n=1 Tax=Candidatus Terasakiella magnetica TaxID=1867952 RepID=UPI000840BEC7|nr:hypothetical protein [Candidatus Terasakiella magnetica]
MALLELATVKIALAGITKAAIAAGPVGLPVVIAGSFGSLILMETAASKTNEIILRNKECEQ